MALSYCSNACPAKPLLNIHCLYKVVQNTDNFDYKNCSKNSWHVEVRSDVKTTVICEIWCQIIDVPTSRLYTYTTCSQIICVPTLDYTCIILNICCFQAHNDVLRTYEAKLTQFGVPIQELGFKPLESTMGGQILGQGPAGLISAPT